MEGKNVGKILEEINKKIADRDLDIKETKQKLEDLLKEHGISDSHILGIFGEEQKKIHNKNPNNDHSGAL